MWIHASAIGIGGGDWPCGAGDDPRRASSRCSIAFLSDGTGLASFGEWACRRSARLSMPLAPGADRRSCTSCPCRFNVSTWGGRALRGGGPGLFYASSRGEADFAKLSSDVVQALNQSR
jgi:hypothetical protein